jgi:hypothetical protein
MTDPAPYTSNGEDCMGNHESCWIQNLVCSDGHIVTAWGTTAAEATEKANRNRKLREDFLNKDPRQQIQEILGKGEDYPCAYDQGALNRAFAKLLGVI